MKKIRNILVPTDFSATARNAFHYAEKLAKTIGAHLNVVHIKESFIPVSDITVTPLFLRDEELLSREALDNFVQDENNDSDTLTKKEIKTHTLLGNPTENLIALSKEPETDWIVMGTTGLQDFISKIIGSISFAVSNQAQSPVFLIPRDATWRPIKRILFASNTVSAQPKMLHQITDIAERFGAAIHFIHVDEGQNEQIRVTDGIWRDLLARVKPTASFQIHSISNENAVKALNQYAIEHDIDVVAFISQHRSFWQNLIHSSITEQFAIITDRPMLIMHIDDK